MGKTVKEVSVIESIYFSGSQSVSYREIYKQKDKKIKVELKSDAYLSQSFARASVLINDKWEVVYNIPASLLSFEEKLIYKPGYNNKPELAAKEFKKDVDKLKEQTAQILF